MLSSTWKPLRPSRLGGGPSLNGGCEGPVQRRSCVVNRVRVRVPPNNRVKLSARRFLPRPAPARRSLRGCSADLEGNPVLKARK
jgi:hypothetical protein